MSMNPNWISAFPRSAVPAGGLKVLRHEHHQIAVVHTREGELFAINNRCPHEGYPLVHQARRLLEEGKPPLDLTL